MVAIIKYNAGNVNSVQNALKRLGAESLVTDDPTEIRNAEKVIFPGVGEASTAMKLARNSASVPKRWMPTRPISVRSSVWRQRVSC